MAVAILVLSIISAILAVDILKLTEPEKDYPLEETKPASGQLTSDKASVSTRCAVIYNITPHLLPIQGKEVQKRMVDIYFLDEPDKPVLSESYYMFELSRSYRVTVEKKSDGALRLISATYECGYRPQDNSPSTRNYQIRPAPPVFPKLPPSLAGFLFIF